VSGFIQDVSLQRGQPSRNQRYSILDFGMRNVKNGARRDAQGAEHDDKGMRCLAKDKEPDSKNY
jgi:hypothetical protein